MSEKDQIIEELTTENRLLKAQLAWFKQKLYGGSKSEKINPNQLELEGLFEPEDESKDSAGKEELSSVGAHQRRGKKKRKERGECFADLPVDEEIELIPEEVKADPEAYELIAEERTFEVDVKPPQFYKREFVRKKFRCKNDPSKPPVIAPAPKRFLPGSYASVNLVVTIILQKYLDHLPLYRQEKLFRRYGARISRQRMCQWIAQAAFWLKPIYEAIGEEIRRSRYVQMDETPTRYLDNALSPGKSLQGFFWVLHHPEGNVYLAWRTNRRHGNVQSLLADYEGLLQSDGYEAYHQYAQSHEGVTHLGCWAHVRRKFYEAREENPLVVRWLLRLIGTLFHYEAHWREENLSLVEIHCRRLSESAMTLGLIKRITEYLSRRELPQGKLGQAITYTLRQWPQLTEYLHHGQAHISNNWVENVIRPTAVGKKNWLFIGHPEAGENSAILYSIIMSCQRHGLSPDQYLRDILQILIEGKANDKDYYAKLTPAAYAAKLEADSQAA